jgi:hypothetical protein
MTVRYRKLGLDTRKQLFSLGVGTMLGRLSPKPTMYRGQQMQIRGHIRRIPANSGQWRL